MTRLLMIFVMGLAVSLAVAAVTITTPKAQACHLDVPAQSIGYGRCQVCYCGGYVFRGNGFCGRCGHSAWLHYNRPAAR
jgi:hypothetical protein